MAEGGPSRLRWGQGSGQASWEEVMSPLSHGGRVGVGWVDEFSSLKEACEQRPVRRKWDPIIQAEGWGHAKGPARQIFFLFSEDVYSTPSHLACCSFIVTLHIPPLQCWGLHLLPWAPGGAS